MSKITNIIKSAAEQIPEPLGRFAAAVPFSWRLGSRYTSSREEIETFGALSQEEQREYVFQNVRQIVEHAYEHVPFYRSLYEDHGFFPKDLKSFDDLQCIPIITKSDLREWSLEKRSHSELDRMEVNTGGTSGNPLHFYLDRNAFAREWAHMHKVWENIGYNQTDLKLTIRGNNVGDRPFQYNAVHNEYVLNGYKALAEISGGVLDLVRKKEVDYIHGYPSAIYEFARNSRCEAPGIVQELRDTLKGVLLGSEYPAPVYRETIEEVFEVPTLSWYGHSEMAIFAPERGSQYVYEPMHTYGYCEAVPDGEGEYRLVGTSYYNTASPFIRYDTGDRVGKIFEVGGLLRRFQVTSGRVGEFVTDRSGHRISLTALVYGRHHEIFEYAEFVQVHQEEPGRAKILITPATEVGQRSASEWGGLFDDSNVDMEIEFEEIDGPIRTSQGKVKLLV